MKKQNQTIGPYRVIKILDQGGMGVLYLCSHEDTGEHVALKSVIKATEQYFQSIRREIRAIRKLDHPGIVKIICDGVQEGVPWYAMELIQGTTLRTYLGNLLGEEAGSKLSEGPEYYCETAGENEPIASHPEPRFESINPDYLLEVITLMRRLCVTLAFLHGKGIVHRDLKPENILIDAESMPVIIDFGLMTQFGAELSRESLSIDFDLGGTLQYMSPEQILRQYVDARTDLYSLGCMLYEILTGKMPP